MTNNIINKKQLDVSLKFGVLALGMGGCSVGCEIGNIKLGDDYPYKALLINSNIQDFRKLDIKNPNTTKKIELKGFEEGAGRDIKVGEKAFEANKQEILEQVHKEFNDRDFVWIVAGLGGGTGSGSVISAIKLLFDNGFKRKLGLILTMPMDDEGGQVVANAIYQFQKITKASKALGSIIVVDNQKIYNDYQKDRAGDSTNHAEFLKFCNKYVADILHEMNVVTKNYTPLGRDNFDVSEFRRMLAQPGFLTLVRKEFEKPTDISNNISESVKEISTAIESGVLSDGYDFVTVKRAAIAMIANEQNAEKTFTTGLYNALVNDVMNDYGKFSSEKPIATYADNAIGGGAKLYAAFAGLTPPKRIVELVEKYETYEQELAQQNAHKDEVLEKLQSVSVSLNNSYSDNDSDLDLDFGDGPNSNKEEEEEELELNFD